MQFLIRAYDGEGKPDKRMEVPPWHLEALMKVLASAIGSLTDAQRVSDTFNSNGIKGLQCPLLQIISYIFRKAL